jgi:hypothetical protein
MNWLDKLVVQYRGDGSLADLFGLILYTDAHANIKKVLRDEDYWKSFDNVSGPYLAVFSIRTPIHRRTRDDDMGFMVSVLRDPEDNLTLLADLQLTPTQKLPGIVWLTRDEGDLLRCIVPLNDRTEDAAYASIKESLVTAAEAVARVAEATDGEIRGGNLRKPLGVFAALNFAIDNKRDVRRLKKAIKIWEFIKDLKP